MKIKTKVFLSNLLLPLTLILSGCGKDGTSITTSSGSGGSNTSGLSLSYQNISNGNALIGLDASSTFPSVDANTATRATVGYFYQMLPAICPGQNISYTFILKNNGATTISAASSPAVTFTDNTDYPNGQNGSAVNYSYTLGVAPAFPLAVGQSTSFRMDFSGHNSACSFGMYDQNGTGSLQTFEMVVHTDDKNNPNYSVDFVIFGNS